MGEPKWSSRRIIDAVHAELIREHGGSHGVRDAGLIDSALARPLHRWTYEESCDLADLAAAYGFGLAKNHGFIDGNTRIVLAALLLFLRLNGWKLRLSEPEAVALMTDVAAGGISETELAAFIRDRLVER
jgi:death on curing protein